ERGDRPAARGRARAVADHIPPAMAGVGNRVDTGKPPAGAEPRAGTSVNWEERQAMAARTSPKAAAKPAAKASGPSPEELLGYYREMLLIRRFEEKAGQL